jgi:release factor glutamine methyltransferase
MMSFQRKEYQEGKIYFCGRPFRVDPRVLVPRRKTETTARVATEATRRVVQRLGEGVRVADLGTGCGVLIITIAKELERFELDLYATDISADALAVAQSNAASYGLSSRIRFCLGDLLTALPVPPKVIVANLPYHPREYPVSQEVACEPKMAVFDEEDGTFLATRLIQQVKDSSIQPAALILEQSPRSIEKIVHFIQEMFQDIRMKIDIHVDTNSKPRVIEVTWP